MISIFKNFHRNCGNMRLAEVLNAIKEGGYAARVTNLQEALAKGDSEAADKLKKGLPGFTLSATYKGRRIDENIDRYNGWVMLDIDKIDSSRVEALKEKAAAIPHTLFCFRSPGGRGLKIGVVPSVSHPVTAENHRQTFLAVQQYYEKLLGVVIDPSGKDVGRLCFVSYDPLIYINPRHVPFLKGECSADTAGLPLMEHTTGAGGQETAFTPKEISQKLSAARKKTTRRTKYEEGNRNNYAYLFANYCNQAGLSAEDVMNYGRVSFADLPETELRNLVNSAYSHTAEHNMEQLKSEEKKERCARLMSNIETTLKGKYMLRFNIVTQRPEWRQKGSKKTFQPINDLTENSMWRELNEKGIACSQKDLHSILISDFCKLYNPFEEYFSSLPEWDGTTDYIGELAETVQTSDQRLWHECLCKWLVAMVACALYDDVTNHTVLMLCSKQGLGKTKWCCNLVPPELRAYRYSGVPNPYSTDSKLTLSECILVNLDEMEGLSTKELSQLKEMITKQVIRERRAYGKNPENYLRRASFTASVNNSQVLGDLTGLRRFLCFEAHTIDYQSPVNYTGVFSQACALLKSGFRYWLDADDIEQINRNNEDFRVRTPEEELFYTYFRKPLDTDTSTTQWLTASQILQVLSVKTFLQITQNGANVLSRVLKKEQFPQIRRKNKRLYGVKRVTEEEIEAENRKTETTNNE